MIINDIVRFIWNHPFNQGRRLSALVRFVRWQGGSRILKKQVIYPFVDDSRLIVSSGITATTGNIYVGLMEFEEMGFTMHYLLPTDFFIDIGANVGVYSVLAAKVAGARCLAVEPIPETYSCLMDNILLNRIDHRVMAMNIGLGKERSRLRFTSGLGTTNRVLLNGDTAMPNIEVDVFSLDDISGDVCPEMIKIDVEGYESQVLAGGEKTFAHPSVNVVLMELRGHGAKFGFNERDIDRRMRGLGFRSYSYNPLERLISPRTEIEGKLGDMMYVRDVEKARDRVVSAAARQIHGRMV